MDSNFAEYKDLYVQTSKEYLQELNTGLLKLEKDPKEIAAIEDIFRSAHSLKSQSAAMGYDSTAFLCHTIEDVFYEIKEGRLEIKPELADKLFEAFDGLTESISLIEKENKEIDLNPLALKLKKETGVTTEGVGKSNREEKKKPDSEVISHTQTVEKTLAVKVKILDDLMDLVEELMIRHINDPLAQKIIESLQYKVMQARAVNVGLVFEHFPRTIRDLARSENKEVELKVFGQDLELDRTVVDRLDEPLIHILRNAVSHGIEKKGIITIGAKNERDYALISVEDNGKGIDWKKLAEKSGLEYSKLSEGEIKNLIFSGISTADKVTEISGRGVGMKVVKKMVEDFGGRIEIKSILNKGTKISLKLPLTLAIVKVIMIKVDNQRYAIPSLQVDRVVNLKKAETKVTADQRVFVLENIEIPLLDLKTRLNNKKEEAIKYKQKVVVVWVNNEKVGLMVDDVSQTEDVVIKELPKSLKSLKLFSGTTIISTGQPALVISPEGLIQNE